MNYFRHNNNPKGKKVGDCVVRAISFATGLPWGHTYHELVKIGIEECDMPNSKAVYEKYLASIGWKKMKMPRKPDNKRYSINEFFEETEKGMYIVKIQNHVTVVAGRCLTDTFDCGASKMGNYWVK